MMISVIIPCRNEKKIIGRCLQSLLNQDFPKEELEILVVDGLSDDGTRETVGDFTKKYPFIKLLDNPKMFTPFALNLGVKEAKGEIIIRMDAHATYAGDYISKCVKYLKEYDADNVGGVIKTLPGGNGIAAKAIALALAHPFGTGGSYFRIGSKEPREVDTVFGGCYKRDVFDRMGLFNENLIRSQDLEFNLRLRKAGGKIVLVPEIVAYYYPSTTTLKDFWKRNFVDGIWAIYPLKFVNLPLGLRHYVPVIFVMSLSGSLILSYFFPIFFLLAILIALPYFLASIYFSSQIALREGSIGYLLIMPIVFAARHASYGLGSIWGFIKVLL